MIATGIIDNIELQRQTLYVVIKMFALIGIQKDRTLPDLRYFVTIALIQKHRKYTKIELALHYLVHH